jgi:hypothetical protein
MQSMQLPGMTCTLRRMLRVQAMANGQRHTGVLYAQGPCTAQDMSLSDAAEFAARHYFAQQKQAYGAIRPADQR